MEIYKYKTIPGNECFYSDTDSVFLQYPQDESLISKEIGKMKQEYIAKEAIFIAPKIYYAEKSDGAKVSKVKGFPQGNSSTMQSVKGGGGTLNREEFYSQLFKDTKITKDRARWIKDQKNLNIVISPGKYNITMTEFKRKPIYENKVIRGKIYKFITHTIPYHIFC